MTAAIFSLWRNWAVAVGMLMVLAVLEPVIPRQYLAPVNFLFFIALEWMHTVLKRREVPCCSRFIKEVSIVILLLGVFMAALYLFARGDNLFEANGQPFNIDSPVIGILLAAPVTAIVTLIFFLNHREPAVCRRCKERFGNVIEHGFIGDLYRREWRYQTGLLFVLAVLLTVVDWGYYFTNYVNINLNRPDRFFFIWMPLTIYVLSVVYLGVRYYSLWVYYCKFDEEHLVRRNSSTLIRYLLINGDRLLVEMHTEDGYNFANGAKIKRFDTPAIVHTHYMENPNLATAISLFREHTHINDAEIRLAYVSPDNLTYNNIFHYFAFLPESAEVADSKIGGEWLTWGNLRQLAQLGLLGRDLVSELMRIYKVAMAWKTYDEKGRRLYVIKHYKPTFRLRDIRKWDVDFNDYHWLAVDRTNEDKFWYPIKRLFNKRMRAGS